MNIAVTIGVWSSAPLRVDDHPKDDEIMLLG